MRGDIIHCHCQLKRLSGGFSDKSPPLFPFRTTQLNLSAPMVLHRGRVGRRRIFIKNPSSEMVRGFLVGFCENLSMDNLTAKKYFLSHLPSFQFELYYM